MSLAYFRFLQLSQTLREGQTLPANHILLLEIVSLAWYEGLPMCVRDAMSLVDLGSQATLHKRLAVLRKHRLIDAIPVEGDRRSKLLVPTDKAIKYFEQLGQAMALQDAQPVTRTRTNTISTLSICAPFW